MELTINQIYSANGNQVHAESACLNRKRKFPAEQLGLPLQKHKSLPSSDIEPNSIKDVNHEGLIPSLVEVEFSRPSSNNISQSESATDFISCEGVDGSTMSISGQVRNDIWFSKARLSDQPSTSPVNWDSTCSTKSLYFVESRSMEDSSSSSDEIESSYNIDFRHENMEQCTEDEDQDVIYSNGVIPNKCVLLSGRWPVNQDKQGAKKLTIDKEFEQYFSSLML